MRQAKQEYIGLFPLGLVVFPGEQTRLHIFEPRYKQLVNDCFANSLDFGIPILLDNEQTGYGSRVKLLDIERFYPDGKMDILVEGTGVFEITSFEENVPGKLYAGGDIRSMETKNRYPKSEELIRLFTNYEIAEGTIPENYTFTSDLGVFQIAEALSLPNADKLKLLVSKDKHQQQRILINRLRLALAVAEQEDLLDQRFFLN